jgi:hypothetical protein
MILSNSELDEIKKECGEQKTTPQEILAKKVVPFQDKISKSNGQLIGAITRHYDRYTNSFDFVHLDETLYTGIITPKTKFTTEFLMKLITGVEKAFSLSLGSPYHPEFIDSKGSFYGYLDSLFFMDKPPARDESVPRIFQTKKPRLELYIGNEETIPLLIEKLEGWRYIQLSKLLGYSLPSNDELTKRIEQEQLKLFDDITEAERKVWALMSEREKRLELVREGEGAIYHVTHLELTDEFVENMRYNPQIKEERGRLLGLLKIAIERDYNVTGMNLQRQEDVGVTTTINLREFLNNRIIKYKVESSNKFNSNP